MPLKPNDNTIMNTEFEIQDRTEKPGLFWEICAGIIYAILRAGMAVVDFCVWYWRLEPLSKFVFLWILVNAAVTLTAGYMVVVDLNK